MAFSEKVKTGAATVELIVLKKINIHRHSAISH
jgi:hypothetical protein